MTAALEATRNVLARVRTSVTVRRTFIDVPARPLVRAEAIPGRTGADEATGGVTTLVRAGPGAVVVRRALVHVRTTGAR